jgi:hypothetical protein
MEANPLPLPVCRATSYVYQPLDDATQSIRLIRLQPALNFESDVQCEIYHVTLGHPAHIRGTIVCVGRC